MTILRFAPRATLRVGEDGETTDFPINSITMNFALNEIPQAHAQVGLGDSVLGDRKKSVITEETMQLLRKNTPARIVGQVTGDFDKTHPWPSESTNWFDGRIQQASNQITFGAAALNVSLNHWLADLASHSLLVNYVRPYSFSGRGKAASSYHYGVYRSGDSVGTANGTRLASLGTLADIDGIINYKTADGTTTGGEALSQDVWVAIKEIFTRLATNPLDRLQSDLCANEVNVPPQKVADALARIQGPSETLGMDYVDGAVPLAMLDDEGGTFRREIIKAIAAQIINRPTEDLNRQNAWTQITSYYAQVFDCRLVPRIDDAIFAPITPGLRDPYCVQLSANDIVQLDSLEPVASSIRKVLMVPGYSDAWNLKQIAKASLWEQNATCYPTGGDADDRSAGKVAEVKPPAFLAHIKVDSSSIENAIHNGQIMGGVGGDTPPADLEDLRNVRDQAAQLMFRHLKAAYYRKKVINRSIKIVSKLRFDISPGTMLRVNPSIDQYRGIGSKPPAVQGLVTRVSIVVDVTRKTAATIFHVNFVRSLSDNELDTITIDHHPFFTEAFYGAPLSSTYKNPACE